MIRLREWTRATHSTHVELVRHFLARFFESDLVTTPGQWAKAAGGVIAALLSACILMVPLFMHRYGCLQLDGPSMFCPVVQDYHAQYLYVLRTDTRWLIGLAICVTAILTALQWQSLFPTLRDCLALASLPVSALEIFWSKLTAVVLALLALVLAMNTVPSLAFAWIIAGRWQENPTLAFAAALFVAATAGCVFVFFSMLAIQGLLLNLLPPHLFERVSVYAQSILFTANVAALPFLWSQPSAAWWPPNWFLGLWSAMLGGTEPGARYALWATGLAPALAMLSYLASYRRYQRLLLEAPPRARRRPMAWPAWFAPRDPREQAMFSFIWKTLTRSRVHRLALQVCAGLAIAWMIGAGGFRGGDSTPVVLVPLAVSIFLIAGLRYLFSLPSELRANWIFQAAESEGRASWLRAVDRFVIVCGLVPVYACTMPAAIAVFGWWQALRVTALGLFMALLVFEFLFRDWHKAPFTCSYLPGKRQFWQVLVAAFATLSYMGTAALAIHAFSAGWVTFAAGFPLLFGLWRWMHRGRAGDWQEVALVYDDVPEPAVAVLDIGFERDSLEAVLPPAEAPVERTPFWNAAGEEDRDAMPFFRPAGLVEDLRYGLRLVRKHYGLSATIVATLALGIGMNVSVFTLMNAVAFRARVPHPETFVRVAPLHAGSEMASIGAVDAGEYLAYRNLNKSLSALAASFRTNVTLESDRSAGVPALLVSCNFFSVYQAGHPTLGRFFRPDECARVGQAPVAVLSEEVWRDRYGADPQILSRTISINDHRFTVVGIAPAETAAQVNGASLWIPYTAQPFLDMGFDPFARPTFWLWLDGRLRPGISRSAAQAEFAVLARQMDSEHPGRQTTLVVTDGSLLSMLPIMSHSGDAVAKGYWFMMFSMLALVMVLFITCANVMTLLLSRAVARRKEIAVRLSLGAPRLRLLRMLLTESVLLAAAAGAISLYLSFHVPRILFEYVAHRRADFSLDPDWRTFAYVFGVALAAGCVSALAPALESLRVDLTDSMKGYDSAAGDATGTRLRTVLVTAQVALSLALLVGAGMFVQAYWRLYHGDQGYETRHVLVAPLRFPAGSTADASRLLAESALTRMAGLPGVLSVARSNEVPFAGSRTASARMAGRGMETAHRVSFQAGAPNLLGTLGIRLLHGRDFRASDPPRVIVSEKLVRALSPGSDPVGRVLETLSGSRYEIIGVARDVNTVLTDDPIVYVFDQWDRRQTYLLARFTGDPAAAEGAVRAAVRTVRSDILVMPQTLQARIDDSLADTWHVVILILFLGAVAMTLSVAGIYGVVSFTVTQKTRELGIRVALGAQRADIFRAVLVAGARPVALGLFLGLWLALAADSAIRSVFANAPLELDAANPGVYLGSALVLAVAALAAMLFPASRGARSDPMKVLHYE